MKPLPLYHLLEEPETADLLGSWEPHLHGFKEIVGYSALGTIFLRDPNSLIYLVLFPLAAGNNAKQYGPFGSTLEFEAVVLSDPIFVERNLKPEKVQALTDRLGPLEDDSVFIPVPYPLLGGDCALDSYDKGQVWVFADLAGQARGL